MIEPLHLYSEEKEQMWKEVYKELMDCKLFSGTYDARNGNERFMHGIATVMEYIAEKAGCRQEFEIEFDRNYIASKKKAGLL